MDPPRRSITTYRKTQACIRSTTIHLFIQQVLNHNTAISNLPHLSKMRFDASAYCDARRRLPREVLEKLLGHVD